METKCVVTGFLDENCYLIIKNGRILDPSRNLDTIADIYVKDGIILLSYL